MYSVHISMTEYVLVCTEYIHLMNASSNLGVEGMKLPLWQIEGITSGTHSTPEQLWLPFHTSMLTKQAQTQYVPIYTGFVPVCTKHDWLHTITLPLELDKRCYLSFPTAQSPPCLEQTLGASRGDGSSTKSWKAVFREVLNGTYLVHIRTNQVQRWYVLGTNVVVLTTYHAMVPAVPL